MLSHLVAVVWCMCAVCVVRALSPVSERVCCYVAHHGRRDRRRRRRWNCLYVCALYVYHTYREPLVYQVDRVAASIRAGATVKYDKLLHYAMNAAHTRAAAAQQSALFACVPVVVSHDALSPTKRARLRVCVCVVPTAHTNTKNRCPTADRQDVLVQPRRDAMRGNEPIEIPALRRAIDAVVHTHPRRMMVAVAANAYTYQRAKPKTTKTDYHRKKANAHMPFAQDPRSTTVYGRRLVR